MYKNFNLTESEKEQILNMHKDKGYGKKLREGDDETYFARHGEGNVVWTGSSNKTYKDLPDGDYDDETYDDFDSLHTTHPEFHSHYSGKGNVDRAKSMFDTYKRSQGPLLIKKRRVQNELNERIYDKEYDVVRGNPDFKTQTGRPVGDYVNKRNAANQFQQDFQGEFPDPGKEARPYWEKDQARPSGDYAYEDSMDDKMLYSKEFKFKEREKKEQEEKINGVRMGLSDLSRGIKSVQKDLEDLFNESASGSSNKFSGLAVLMTSPLVKHYVDLYDSRYRGYNSYRDNLIKLTGEDMGNTESSKSFMEKLVTSYMGQK